MEEQAKGAGNPTEAEGSYPRKIYADNQLSTGWYGNTGMSNGLNPALN